MLVVIGPRWATITDGEGRRRLEQPGDWIRLEVARALQRDVRLIPVLLEDTPLPDAAVLPTELRGLVRRQTLALSDGRWKGDIGRLVETLGRIPGLQRVAPAPAPAPVPQPAGRGGLWKGVGLGAGGLLLLAYLVAEPTPATSPAGPGGEASAPAAAPAPSPAPVPAATQRPQSAAPLAPPAQLQAIAERVLQGRWQVENDPTVFVELQQVGDRVNVQFQANGLVVGQGQGRFDGRQLVLQAQAELFGQALAQGRCTLQWVPAQSRLVGPCVWPTGEEATVWARRG